ncbi:MAG: hypothetical protein KAW89_04475 [Armatimonadetes bacterium]|nr:hypothetical protein [Armatimonadota bacterium]
MPGSGPNGDGNQYPTGIDWVTEGAPQHWAQWKHITGSYTTIRFNAESLGRADNWQEAFCHHIVPAGAVTAVLRFGAENLEPEAVVEFTNPYFAKIPQPSSSEPTSP